MAAVGGLSRVQLLGFVRIDDGARGPRVRQSPGGGRLMLRARMFRRDVGMTAHEMRRVHSTSTLRTRETDGRLQYTANAGSRSQSKIANRTPNRSPRSIGSFFLKISVRRS